MTLRRHVVSARVREYALGADPAYAVACHTLARGQDSVTPCTDDQHGQTSAANECARTSHAEHGRLRRRGVGTVKGIHQGLNLEAPRLRLDGCWSYPARLATGIRCVSWATLMLAR